MRTKRTRRIENPTQYMQKVYNGIETIAVDPYTPDDLEISCTCKCHCGRIFHAPLWRIISEVQKSCGVCGNGKPVRPIRLRNDLTGKVFGQLTVVGLAGRNTQNRITYNCVCSCGNSTIVSSNNLISGNTKSCGRCNYARQQTAEAQRIYSTPEESHLADCTYSDMKRRCYDPKFPEFRNYGAKGITMCDEWRNSPKAYVDWCMTNGWKPGLTVDRIDNSKGYGPDNCRIVDKFVQANNKSNNKYFTIENETHALAEWCRSLDLVYDNVRNKPDDKIIEILSKSLLINGTLH